MYDYKYEQPRCDLCGKFLSRDYKNSLYKNDGLDIFRLFPCKKCVIKNIKSYYMRNCLYTPGKDYRWVSFCSAHQLFNNECDLCKAGFWHPILTQEMKDWFGQGEYDVNLMLRMNVVTPELIIEMWFREHSKKPVQKDNEQPSTV